MPICPYCACLFALYFDQAWHVAPLLLTSQSLEPVSWTAQRFLTRFASHFSSLDFCRFPRQGSFCRRYRKYIDKVATRLLEIWIMWCFKHLNWNFITIASSKMPGAGRTRRLRASLSFTLMSFNVGYVDVSFTCDLPELGDWQCQEL